jgi:hypothetical protein
MGRRRKLPRKRGYIDGILTLDVLHHKNSEALT